MEKKIIIVCGEPSGDLQASLLLDKLKQLDNDIKAYAIGGDFLKRSGAEIIHDIKDLSVLGVFDALKKLGKFVKLMRLILKEISTIKPCAVIFVDFSGFNLRLALEIDFAFGKKNRPKTVYYISPQVWASRPGRVETIKRLIDKLIVIFKFEEEFYKKLGINAEFVGHPLLDVVKPTIEKKQAIFEFKLKENEPIFSLLPGSRISEIKNILPIMLESAYLIKEKIPQAQFIISKPLSVDMAIYKSAVEKGRLKDIKIIEAKPYDCLNVADFVLVASGTATLETAIMQKPNVVIYKLGLLNYLIYKPQVKIPFIGMENIVAGKEIAPEFIQFKAKPKLIAKTVLDIFFNTGKLLSLQKEFTALKEKLSPHQAPERAAEAILTFLNSCR